jgi:hypothetical protein
VFWNLSNSTQYAAGVALLADRDGRDVWLTVVKATFDIDASGQATPADEQLPVVYAPLFAGEPARSSLLAESDIDYAKTVIDVLVQGTVHPAHGEAVRQQLVGLEVDGRSKHLRVHGERTWCRRAAGVDPSSAKPFSPVRLDYEHAFGGFDPSVATDFDERNPAGCGYARHVSDLVDTPAPRIEYADRPIEAGHHVPAGFGPVARHWMPRRRHAGTYDATWREQRLPLLPLDFDERYFASAPEDQQFAQLRPQAAIRVTGMRSDGPLEFRLPRLALGLNVHSSRGREHRRPSLRTVLVLPDSRKLVLSYADAMECTGRKYGIRDVEVIEKEFIQ